MQKGRLSTAHHVDVEVAPNRWLFASVNGQTGSKVFVARNGRFEFKLTLAMNLNRFLAHHAGRSLAEIADLHPCEALRIEQGAARPAGLDGNDNLVPFSVLRRIPLSERSAFIARALRIYCDHVRALFALELDLPPELLTRNRPCSYGTVQQAEICWDLLDPDPTTRVVEIERVAAAVSCDIEATKFSGDGCNRDARWLSIDLTNDVNLKIYAKDQDRLRFEIAYRRIRQEARREGVPQGDPVGDLLAMRAAAAGRIARFWRPTSQRLRETPQVGDLMDFLERLLAVNRRAKLTPDRRPIFARRFTSGERAS
ncbi:hypothetical protein [Aquibium sp. ELW1220]|uniref:hypothetical protein n=1 Tax=Aquibium sp. ELW1220 TaxID=2976766 RepID=UPI0025B14E88|nr:hypothetical protein [Aquibium sp. ELW1220]MDN2584027.1 hypothetical protein [Aquibium sp. ELW1220]